jgi:uncharacterized protein
MAALLLLFLKAPRPGQVKTRLAATLGPERAAAVARALAERVIEQTRPEADEYGRVIVFTPAAARADIERWLPGLSLWEQEGDDLGARMDAAFARALGHAPRVLLAGTDVPHLGRAHVHEALAALETADVVLGPARDGGYYLIGLSRPQPALFRGLAWSGPQVLAATRERAAALGLGVHLLPVLGDVDTEDDLRAEWPGLEPPDRA